MPRPAATAAITAKTLDKIGRLLYGEQWKSPLADDLGISYRNMQYFAAGERVIHDGIARDLAAIVKRRADELGKAAAKLLDEIERTRSQSGTGAAGG